MPPMVPAGVTSEDDFASGKPGSWHKREWSDLDKIASRTRDTSNAKTKIDVDLIPDVWARHILFANALYDERHMLHERVRGEFRGLLALLALRARKRILVKAEELQIDQCGDWPFALAAKNGIFVGHGIHQLYSDTGWNEVYLLRSDGRSVLAVTSPLTLICPAQGLGITGLTNMPSSWFDGVRFRDPSAKGVLNQDDREVLAGWLAKVEKELAQRSVTPRLVAWNPGHERLLEAIGKFKADLNVEGNPRVVTDESGLNLGHAAYQYLAMTVRPEEIDLSESDLMLDSTITPRAVLLPFRVGDKDVSFEPKTEPSHITVVTGTSVLDIKTTNWGKPSGTLANSPLPEGAEWLDPKDLFLPRLYMLEGTQASSGMWHARGQREVADQVSDYPVLPFSQKLTELLPADVIVKNVHFSIENQGSGDVVVVKLKLPLRGGKTLQVTRSYSTDQQSSFAGIPVLEVWPPFRKKDWKHYNTFWWSNSAEVFEAEPFPLQNGHRLVEETESLAGNEVRVTSLNSAPDGFLLKVPHPQRVKAQMQEAGMIFIRYLDMKEVAPSGVWKAGVDFGTSSTHVVLRAPNEGNENPLRLGRSSPLRVVVGRDAERLSALYKYFLPVKPDAQEEIVETSPFLSFLRMRHPEQTEFEPILGAHILFYNPSHNVQEFSAGRLDTNLKWGGSHSRSYLEQLCLQAAAEAALGGAQAIDWSYSLPAAFSLHRQSEYQRVWKKLTTFVATETGLGSTQAPVKMMESFAAACYFKEREQAPPKTGAIILDIGGGTTDISIWQESEELYGVSIRFAGRDMFLAPLFEIRSRLIPEFARVDPKHISQATVSRLLNDQNPNDFYAHSEAMLRDAGKGLAQKLDQQHVLDTVALPLRFAIAGLFYYVGIILRHLMKRGKYKPSLGGIFLGGNGSQLLHWADGGDFIRDGVLTTILIESLLLGADWNENRPKSILVKLSDKPKQEAATGLVVKSNLKQESRDEQEVLAGEPIRLEDNSLRSESEPVSRKALSTAELEGLPQLSAFYDNYVRLAKKIGYPAVSLNKDELFVRANERVREFLADQKTLDEDQLDAMPPFIKALQSLVIGVANETSKSLSAASGR